ncbi:MAG TPA: CpaF family protein [Candidatus Acidoferrales bacterium]|nr:CpaF family protein [Candidatus Acidoferrales bacterium]
MKDKPAMLEVLREGERARLFRFTEPEIKIGFNPRCNLSLEPHNEKGSELLLKPLASTLSVLNNPGAFQLNGSPCKNEMPVKPGDIITGNSYRITIRDLPGVSAPGAEPAPAEPPPPAPEPAPKEAGDDDEDHTRVAAAVTGNEKAPEKKEKGGLSYLYLFFGPVKEYLMDDDVSEIMINGPSQIYIERKGKTVRVPAKFANEQALQAAIMNVARSIGRFYDKDNPRLDARLPDGSRVHACIPPLARVGSIVAIRKFRKEKLTVDQLVSYGSLTQEGARLLDVIVKIGRNLIVSGATSSGKTSVLNVLSALIPDHDRILVLEDASELQLQQEHKVCFETRKADEYGKGEVSIRDLLHSALRLRPDRIVVGEIRSGEALDLLQAMNTGHEGSMSTIHANTPRDSLFRMETCALLSGVDIPLSALREQVGSAIHMVIQTARLHDGTRKITAITEVLGLKDQQYQLHDIYVFKNEGTDTSGKIIGKHVFTGYKPSFYQSAQQHGFNLDGLFIA